MYLRPDPNKPNKSFVQSLIRDAHNPRKKNQANALGELHTMDNSYEERLTFEGFINLDGIYIGVISFVLFSYLVLLLLTFRSCC